MIKQLWFCFCRDEGGLEYKSSIADTIITIIEENPEAKENGLSHLCEFIEDCEHTSLAVRILHLLGAEGPKMAKSSLEFIPFEAEIDNYGSMNAVLSKLDMKTIKLSGFAELLKVCSTLTWELDLT